jgi:hypothetical protein
MAKHLWRCNPVRQAGSYALSEFDNINPYNGSLNFRLPLLSIGGRGTAGYTMTLPVEQKSVMHVQPIYLYVYNDGGNGPLPDPQVSYIYFSTANWWSGIRPGYGPGVLQGRVAQLDAQVCSDSTMRAVMTLTSLSFAMQRRAVWRLVSARAIRQASIAKRFFILMRFWLPKTRNSFPSL